MLKSSDLNAKILNLTYPQISAYLIANDWVCQGTVASFDIYTFDNGRFSCEVLLPVSEDNPSYPHRLADILLILQMLKAPSLEDISDQIRDFCDVALSEENNNAG